jgi:hypothetical protein
LRTIQELPASDAARLLDTGETESLLKDPEEEIEELNVN